ncbi:hypothetical protein AGMMS49587_00070 [Spirochaetia bacterium]|nr:hypothetical protein AGMMS49587_00070 [Spirochaetia bacterium]
MYSVPFFIKHPIEKNPKTPYNSVSGLHFKNRPILEKTVAFLAKEFGHCQTPKLTELSLERPIRADRPLEGPVS